MEAPFVVLDTELTGLDPSKDTILSIGALHMKGASILLGELYYREIYAQKVSQETVPVHQIRPEDLKTCPEARYIIPEFADFIAEHILVGFHLKIDLTFLKKAFKQHGLNFPKLPALDAFFLYRGLKKKVLKRTPFIKNKKPQKVSTT